jgi:hypothetical protein
MKTHVVAQASKDWADEFSCEFFGVYTREKWNDLVEKLRKAWEKRDSSVEISFGTNESLEFADFQEWFESFTVAEISEEEADFLTRTFGQTFGTGSGALSCILSAVKDIDEDEDAD